MVERLRDGLAWIVSPRARRMAVAALPMLVVAYAACLRLDAITLQYGIVARPAALRALQVSLGPPLRLLRPGDVTWEAVELFPHRDGRSTRYRSDPYVVLERAAEMRSFYEAHEREPVFTYTTRVFLWLTGGQDIAVSLASALFSALIVLGTYMLGTSAFSRPIGLGAALLMALEYDVITWGTGGWRDDAFTFAVVASAYAMLRFSRAPTRGHAVLLGGVAGFACLVRLTSVSFLVPGFAYLLMFSKTAGWKERVSRAGLAVTLMSALIAPFLISCWLAFGDPLYAINFHIRHLPGSEASSAAPPGDATVAAGTHEGAIEGGQPAGQKRSAVSYLRDELGNRPLRALDRVAMGLTVRPYSVKWHGFDYWVRGSGRWLSIAGLLGMILFARSGAGRLLLFVLVTSLAPVAWTSAFWSDWRFTEHAYPFYLIAVCVAVGWVAWLIRLRWVRPALDWNSWKARRTAVVGWPLFLGVLAAAIWVVGDVLPFYGTSEALDAGEDVGIVAGERDRAFFGDGWSEAVTIGAFSSRASRGPRSDVWFPLPRVAAYRMTLRFDPLPRVAAGPAAPRPTLLVFLNGTLLGSVDLETPQDPVGKFDFQLPTKAVRRGSNRLTLVVAHEGTPVSVRLRYVRLGPPPRHDQPGNSTDREAKQPTP